MLLLIVWAVAGWLAVSSGVADANRRLTPDAKSALSPQGGLLTSHSTTILMLGTDNSALAARAGDMHSDSILLLRTIRRTTASTTSRSHATSRYRSPGTGHEDQCRIPIGGTELALRTIRDSPASR